jgi:sortase A
MNLLKTFLRRILLTVNLAGFVLSLVLIFNYILKTPIPNSSASLTTNPSILSAQKIVHVGLPTRLKIPIINVDAPVEDVGITPAGAMDVPKDPADTAWLKLGPRPGENGNAVIAGHFDQEGGKPAVFNNLHKLQQGDKLYVEDQNGSITTFVVRVLRTYDKDEDASDVFASSDGQIHLNLITCEGFWDKTQNSYPNRLVVFTDRATLE